MSNENVDEMDDLVYLTRAECRRVTLAAFDLWASGLRKRLESAVEQIDKDEIRGGLWGPDALVVLISDTAEAHLRTTSIENPAMATVIEMDRLGVSCRPPS